MSIAFYKIQLKEEKTSVITLDRHLEKYGLKGKTIDFIYCDIQGAEKQMIAGANESLKKTRYLYTEYSNSEDYENQAIGI